MLTTFRCTCWYNSGVCLTLSVLVAVGADLESLDSGMMKDHTISHEETTDSLTMKTELDEMGNPRVSTI